MADTHRVRYISTYGTQRWSDTESGWSARISPTEFHLVAGAEGAVHAPLWKLERMLVGLGFIRQPTPPAPAMPCDEPMLPDSAPAPPPIQAEPQPRLPPQAIPVSPPIKREVEVIARYAATVPTKRPAGGPPVVQPITRKPLLLGAYGDTLPRRN